MLSHQLFATSLCVNLFAIKTNCILSALLLCHLVFTQYPQSFQRMA